MVVVGSEACFEWLGSCSKLKRGPLVVTKSGRCVCAELNLAIDREDHSKSDIKSRLKA